MNGQWVGEVQGTNSGKIVLDLDDVGDRYEGHATIFENDPNLPNVLVHIATESKAATQRVQSRNISFLNRGQPVVVDRADLIRAVPNLNLPSLIEAKLSFGQRRLALEWSTDIGTKGRATLRRSMATSRSPYRARRDVRSWKAFRAIMSELEPGRYIFRGQDCSKRLRTSFHRTGRSDLIRYLLRDVPLVHRALSGQMKYIFDLTRPEQNGAFLNLLQHHGYPTPLLDWSYSPFVAAFFALRSHARSPSDQHEAVRIFMFDRKAWSTDFNQVQSLTFAQPHFSILEALTIENPRATPQQALLTATNVDDIESYIRGMEVATGKSYLQVFDLPSDEARSVMNELKLMGITAGSLFPGLDGVLETLRDENFPSR